MIRQIGTLFLTIGIIFIILSAGLLARQEMRRSNYCKVVAEVIGEDADGTKVRYEFEGNIYLVTLGYHNSSQQPGDYLELLCNPDNPEEVFLVHTLFYMIFFVAGLLAFILGSLLLLRWFYQKKEMEHLLEHGQKIYAQVISMKTNYHYRTRFSYARNLLCRYQAPDGTIHVFKSEPVFLNITDDLRGNEIPVYVEPGNLKKYYVDVRMIAPKVEIFFK